MDILIIIAEVGFLIITFYLLNRLLSLILKQSIKISWLKTRSQHLTNLHQVITKLVIVTCVALCLMVIGVNGALIYQGKNIQEVQLDLLRRISPQFLLKIGTAIAKIVSLLLLVKLSLPFLHRFLDWVRNTAQRYNSIIAKVESIDAVFNQIKQILTNSVWSLSVILCTQFIKIPNIVQKYLFIGLKFYLIIALGLLLIRAISIIIDTLDDLSLKYSGNDNFIRYYERIHHLIPSLKKYGEFLIYIGMATLIVQDIQFLAWITAYTPSVIKIIGILLSSSVLNELGYFIIEESLLKTKNLSDLQRQRRLTIIPLIKSFLKYAIYFTAGFSILKIINIDPTPILAGAGIVGIAVGFGAQNLINDIVCGFFILFENYYLVGDYIEAGKGEERNVEGTVEAIELRTTRIRHPNGQLQIIRNGDIGSIVNYSKEYIYALVDIPVSYDTNLNHFYQVIAEVGQQLQQDCQDVLEPTQVDGLENLGKRNLLIRTLTKVKPGKHLLIQRHLRELLRNRFIQNEIEISSDYDDD